MLWRALVLLLLGAAFSQAGPLAASNLLVEYLPSPVLGVDVNPRFSWQLAHTDRAQGQSAYQITVYTTSPSQPVWSSKVSSSQTSQIEYAGTTLESDTSYYWTVTWWDLDGNQSPPSVVANFDTGFFNESLWAGVWIGGANQLRTEFTLPETYVTRARLFISGMGYYVATINGNRVGNHVLGPWTQYESRSLYDVYDVGTLLVPGDNAIAVALGKGFYGTPSVNIGPVALICQLSVTFSDGTHQWFAESDYSWKAINGPVVFDDVYIGENYDARLATIGWDKPGYNDSTWANAAAPSKLPPGKLQAYLAYAQQIVEVFSPVSYWECMPNIYVFDFGQNMAGYSQIRAIGPAGTMITIQHSEMVSPVTSCLEFLYSDAPMVDNFTLAGTGEWEYFAPEFVYHGFQYVQISGYPGVPAPETLQAFFIHSAFPETGSFMTSSPLLDYIDHMTKAAAIANFQSIPTDCPTREKRGWLGDAQVSAETQIHYWDMAAAYTKFVQDIQDSQTKIGNGNVGDTAPWYNWGATPADPAWGTAYTLLWYWSYLYYNDTRMLATHYDGVKWYIDTLISQANNDTHLLAWARYGDWCAVADPAMGCAYPSPVVTGFYYILQLEAFAEAAAVLGNSNDSVTYTKLAVAARAEYATAYYHPNNYTFDMGFQTYQVLPLVLGVVPESNYDDVVNYLLNDVVNVHSNHLTVGIVGAKYLLPALNAIGRADVAWAVATSVGEPSWNWFAAQGGTTLWENWQSTSQVAYGSRNHIMFGGQAAWYYTGIAGIQMTEGTLAYSDITIDPQVVFESNLTFVSASLNTQRGQILSSYSHSMGMCAAVPENQDATISCAEGVITAIEFASFGTPTGTCGDFQIDPSCNANDTMSIVSSYCLGKSSCSVPATDAVFKDPCFDVVKRLYIQVAGCNFAQFSLQAEIPVNSMGNVAVDTLSLSDVIIKESNVTVWQNNAYVSGGSGILNATNRGDAIVFRVGSGSYNFQVWGEEGQITHASAAEGDYFKAGCPEGYEIGRINSAEFGTGSCSLGSSKHVVERNCLYENECAFKVSPDIFGDANHVICGKGEHTLQVAYVCRRP